MRQARGERASASCYLDSDWLKAHPTVKMDPSCHSWESGMDKAVGLWMEDRATPRSEAPFQEQLEHIRVRPGSHLERWK